MLRDPISTFLALWGQHSPHKLELNELPAVRIYVYLLPKMMKQIRTAVEAFLRDSTSDNVLVSYHYPIPGLTATEKDEVLNVFKYTKCSVHDKKEPDAPHNVEVEPFPIT